MDITHDNVCSSMLSCFYSHLLSTGRPISSLNIFIVFIHISASPGLKRGIIQHFITSFEEFLCTCRRDEVVGESSCVVPAAFLLLHRRLYLHDLTSIYFFVVEKH